MGLFRLQLIGPFCIFGPDGARIDIQSKKGAALVAMLAMARGAEHTRGWLQDRLWGSRQQRQAQASLRNELLTLRAKLNAGPDTLLVTEGDRVRLDLARIAVDAHQFDFEDRASLDADYLLPGEFLEGLDIAGEEGFEDWLREQRANIAERIARMVEERATAAAQATIPLPAHIVDLAEATPGFNGRPTLAVLPFANLTDNGDNDYLADGISEALIERVSRLRWMPVIASSSSFAYRATDLDRRAVGQALGARYLLEGRLSCSGEGFLLKVSLLDTESGHMIWSQNRELPAIVSSSAIDHLVDELVGFLDTHVNIAEQERVLAKPVDNLSVNDMIWRARWHLNRYTREDAALAKELINKALAAEPNSPDALIQATYSFAWSVWSFRRPESEIQEMRKLAQRAIAADPLDGRGYMLAGLAETWLRRPARAKLLLHQAIRLNPSLSHAHAVLGSTLYLNGEPAEAIEPLRTALRLSPHDEQVFRVLGELAVSHCMLENWESAIDHADQSLIRRPAYWFAHVSRIKALVGMGEIEEARRARAELDAAKPGFTIDDIDWLPFVDVAWCEYLKEGLRRSE